MNSQTIIRKPADKCNGKMERLYCLTIAGGRPFWALVRRRLSIVSVIITIAYLPLKCSTRELTSMDVLLTAFYFFETVAAGLRDVKLYPQSLIGLTFTGRVKAREYVHGYEWARFHYRPDREHVLDGILTSILQAGMQSHFTEIQRQYHDVHDRNVLFEIRDDHEKGLRIPIRDWEGHFKFVRVGLQAIDVR